MTSRACVTTGILNLADAPEHCPYGAHRQSAISFDEIGRAALPVLAVFVRRWLPDGRREGAEWVARNPRRTDRKAGSFRVNLRTGLWSDFATGDKGGDVISLAAYLDGCSQMEAAERLADELGLGARP